MNKKYYHNDIMRLYKKGARNSQIDNVIQILYVRHLVEKYLLCVNCNTRYIPSSSHAYIYGVRDFIAAHCINKNCPYKSLSTK